MANMGMNVGSQYMMGLNGVTGGVMGPGLSGMGMGMGGMGMGMPGMGYGYGTGAAGGYGYSQSENGSTGGGTTPGQQADALNSTRSTDVDLYKEKTKYQNDQQHKNDAINGAMYVVGGVVIGAMAGAAAGSLIRSDGTKRTILGTAKTEKLTQPKMVPIRDEHGKEVKDDKGNIRLQEEKDKNGNTVHERVRDHKGNSIKTKKTKTNARSTGKGAVWGMLGGAGIGLAAYIYNNH
jgi:hypothetical protein